MRIYVICPEPRCGFGVDAQDIRMTPQECPECGRLLIWECPHCEALLRSTSGTCTLCGKNVRTPATLW